MSFAAYLRRRGADLAATSATLNGGSPQGCEYAGLMIAAADMLDERDHRIAALLDGKDAA